MGKILARPRGETYAQTSAGGFVDLATELTLPEVEATLRTLPVDGRVVFASPSDRFFRHGMRLWTSADGSEGQAWSLDIEGSLEISTHAGISARGSLSESDGTPHDIDLVLVNFELCRN